MNWAERSKSIKVGDRVCFSRTFLQSTAQHTGDVPFARGTVKELITLGQAALAVVDWDRPDIPQKVNVANLSRVTEQGIQESP